MAATLVGILLMCSAIGGQVSKAQDCGVAPRNTRIVGGENAAAGAWPWQVSIHLRSFICSGTLIADQWVLTAAHCIITNQTSAFNLYLGRETQSGPNVNEVTRNVSKIITHADFNNTLYDNDIALMKLSSPVIFTNFIRPICLASNVSQFSNSTLCWATGWGRVTANVSLPPSQPLQEVEIPVTANDECSSRYTNVPGVVITDRMICAGQENKGACQGDSGGPLQCKQDSTNLWVQAGITSFGIPCATAGFPEVYARVSKFQAWIRGQDLGTGGQPGFVTFNSIDTSSVRANELSLVVISVSVFLPHIFA